MNDMHQELKQLLLTELNIEDISLEEWKDDTPLFGDGIGLDSLDAVEIVVLIEKHYGVTIANADEGKHAMVSVNTLVDFIKGKKANG